MNTTKYFNSHIFPILKKNKVKKRTFNNYKKQLGFILKNKHIIEINYIESNEINIPFDEIRWYIICNICEKKSYYEWKFRSKSRNKNKSLIVVDCREKYRGIKNIKDFFEKNFYTICKTCVKCHINNFNDLVKKINSKNPNLLKSYEIINDNYIYPYKLQSEEKVKLKHKKTGEIINRHIGTCLRDIPVPDSLSQGTSKEEIFLLEFMSIFLNIKITHALNGGQLISNFSTKRADGVIDNFNYSLLKNMPLYSVKYFKLNFCENNSNKFIIEYSPDIWHGGKNGYGGGSKDRDANKIKEFNKMGYNIITITNEYYNKLKYTSEFKKLYHKINDLWAKYDRSILSYENRLHISKIKKKYSNFISTEFYCVTFRTSISNIYRINYRPSGTFLSNKRKCFDVSYYGYQGSSNHKQLFTKQYIINNYLDPCNNILKLFLNDKKFTFNMKEHDFELYRNIYKVDTINKKIDLQIHEIKKNARWKTYKSGSKYVQAGGKFLNILSDQGKSKTKYFSLDRYKNENECKKSAIKWLNQCRLNRPIVKLKYIKYILHKYIFLKQINMKYH